MNKHGPSTWVLLVWTLLGFPASAAPPDLTKGASKPEDARHDWNLGATGLRGWIHSDKLVTTDARQIAITRVAEGSPAAGILEAGDVILGAGGNAFAFDPRTEFGEALRAAEVVGTLRLRRWRAGEVENVEIALPVLGDYSATAPYRCAKSARILEQGCEALARRIAAPRGRTNPITRSLNALALLSSGDPSYLPLVKQEVRWAAEFSADRFQTWYYGYVITLLAEYQLATGDEGAMPGLRRLALEAARGQSLVGSWGHRFANPDGRLGGYGMMNAPGLPLTIGLVLAREAGVDEAEVGQAIERSARLMRFYIGKGAVPYGDHHPWIQTHEDNGKCGMAAVLFDLMGEAEGAEFFSRMSVASHGAERDTGHTGNFFNLLWAIPGVARSGPRATGAWMQEFGGWYFDLARRPDGTFVHQGPPQKGNDRYPRWDCTGAYLLAYAMPRKILRITGRKPSSAPQLMPEEAQALIEDGRGWTNKDRHRFYDQLTTNELLTRLKSWSPVVRERVAMALARRDEKPVPTLLLLLKSSELPARYGACVALAHLGRDAAAAVPLLTETLRDPDLWLRIKAAEALAAIGGPAVSAIPELLHRLAQEPTPADVRGMEQRYLCFALFNARGGMLGRSLRGVDREALYKAVRAGLRNEDGRARGSFRSIYQNLTFAEIKPLLPAIHRAIVEPAPSGIMFADGIRMEGLKILAKHRVREGMDACVLYLGTQNSWASEKRTPQMLDTLLTYGTHAKAVTEKLDAIAQRFADGERNFPRHLSLEKANMIREAIAKIDASEEAPELISIEGRGVN